MLSATINNLSNWFFVFVLLGSSRFFMIPIPIIIVWAVFTVFYILIIKLIRKNKNSISKIFTGYWPLKFYLFYVVLMIVAGVFVQENYWERKDLVNHIYGYMIPLMVFLFIYPQILQSVVRCWYHTSYIFVIPYFFLIHFWGIPWALGLLPFFILFLPAFNDKKIKIVLFVLAFAVPLIDLEGRSVLLKFVAALSVGFLSLFIKHISRFKFRIIISSFFVTPVILLILACTNIFNVFNMQEFLSKNGIIKLQDNNTALVDTRSFIYEEQIYSSIYHNYYIWGRTPARGYDSIFGDNFLDHIRREKNTSGDKGNNLKNERHGCEVEILNQFNFFGLIGVVLFTMVFLSASWMSYSSNNIYVKLCGIYVAFRYMLTWVEDMAQPSAPYVCLWIFIAICYSPFFRNMTNREFSDFMNSCITKQKTGKTVSCNL